jgi:integrase
MESVLLDAAGRPRSPATVSGFHSGRPPRNECLCRCRHKHQLRHAHAIEMAREGIPITVIQRQLGHADLGVTSVCLRGIDNREIIDTVHERRAPVMSASAGLRIAQ